ncbi:ADP compounds hydrolase NudE [Alkalilimnicola sp. S0819]|uniref:ADP compounds hydrolase NudE n=1 Tax=Alkalilimnicola sp. S0819 TaxID=2613922 RepID=UPI001261B1ED|nr:ADP compounds hydrolase NudE [Alkalilimnicola sp. S0819]KAB7623045.1 ADP compounds hydrolase NudE [Alkalilimnicola sp. S0819]MPQ17094.1 ADP compounds hydrolase NudE [Alkalilimnicola sp. S0819]
MPKKPHILARRSVARSRLFHVEALDLRFANGEERVYERLAGSGGGAVLVVPITAEREVLLIREYAAGTDDYVLALPKGRVEPGEAPLAAADRELREEVGLGARSLIHLRTVSVAPGYMSHRTQLILARDLYHSPLEGDEPEPIEVQPWPLDAISELAQREDFHEARSLAALYLARELLEKEEQQA